MAEERVTQLTILVEAGGAAEAVTQAGILAEISGAAAYITQAGALAELAYSTERVTQLGTLVEIDRLTVGRQIAARLTIAWDGTNFIDETAYLVTAQGESKLTPPGAAIVATKGIVDRMTLSLYNPLDAVTGRRYSPLNEDGPLYTYLVDGGSFHRPVRFDVSINDGAFERVFTGIIKIPTEGAPTLKNAATVNVECRSVDEELLQLKISTDIATFKAQVDVGANEAQLIIDILEDPTVGMSPSDYTLDSGLFSIPFCWLDDESVLDELWQLAAATGGRFYADRNGKLVYENMQHWLFHAPGETFDRSTYADLKMCYNDADLYSVTTVEAAPRRLGATIVLWEPDELIQVPAGGVRTVTAKLKQPAYQVDAITFQARTSAGWNISADVTLTHVDYAQRIELSFTNANTTYAAAIDAMQITGIPVLGAPTIEEKAESSNAFWAARVGRNRSVRGNVYVQARAQANALAEFLRDVQELPRLEYTMSGTLGVPTRELGDLVTIADDLVMSTARAAYLTAISWSFGKEGYRQTLTAVDAANVFKYSLAEYFIINTDTLESSVGKRVFY